MRSHRKLWSVIRKMIAASAWLRWRILRAAVSPEPAPVAAQRHVAVIELGTWRCCLSLNICRNSAMLAEEEMLRTFNMGLGMLIVVLPRKFKRRRPCWSAPRRKVLQRRPHVKGDRKVISARAERARFVSGHRFSDAASFKIRCPFLGSGASDTGFSKLFDPKGPPLVAGSHQASSASHAPSRKSDAFPKMAGIRSRNMIPTRFKRIGGGR